jgi:hypothetical protein
MLEPRIKSRLLPHIPNFLAPLVVKLVKLYRVRAFEVSADRKQGAPFQLYVQSCCVSVVRKGNGEVVPLLN